MFLSVFGIILLLCDSILSQEIPRREVQVPDRSEREWQGLQSRRDTLEKALKEGYPAPFSEEQLQRLEERLDTDRRERRVSDEELQRRQAWLDRLRQGKDSPFSEMELQSLREQLKQVEEQQRQLAEERQQRDESMAKKGYIETLLQKGFAHREQIKSGQMSITSHWKRTNRDGNVEHDRNRKIILAFDGERQLVDEHNDYAPDISYDQVGCFGCYNGDNRLHFYYSNPPVGQREPKDVSIPQYGIDIWDRKQLVEDEISTPWTHHLGFIPQYVAYFSGNGRFPTKKGFEIYKNLLLANTISALESGYGDVVIAEEDYKGTLCKKLEFKSIIPGSIGAYTIWIAEGQGYALRKQYYTSSLHDETLEVDVALDKDSGIWFPTSWNYERIDKEGRYLLHTEQGAITDIVLNKPIPEGVFDMKNIKTLPAGASVTWHAQLVLPPHGEQRVGALLWDGNDIVTQGMFNEGLVAKMAAENKSNRIKTIVLVNVSILALICAIFLWRYYQHLKRLN